MIKDKDFDFTIESGKAERHYWMYIWWDRELFYILAYHKGRRGELYNIGGRNERINFLIVDQICSILDKVCPVKNNSTLNIKHTKLESYTELISFVADRAGYDRRYATDATKIETQIGCNADEIFDTGIVKTVNWYMNKYKICKKY